MTTPLMRVLRRVVPGVGRVQQTIGPFALAWEVANAKALAEEDPLWVALGDSMTQGVGAVQISGSWVTQLQTRLREAGRPMRVVNLSVTGAGARNVLEVQLPALRALGVTPGLITILIGANDMWRRERRVDSVSAFEQLLSELPDTEVVVATQPRPNAEATAINRLIHEAAGRGVVTVADVRSGPRAPLRGTLSPDHFHPNEKGYAGITDLFARALGV